jgi:hypothetical protein
MDALPWFPCEQRALLEALGNMGQAEQHIYLIILLRIYDCGGVCRDTIDVLAMRTRHRRKVVQQAIENLFRSGRLVSDGNGGMSNPRADRELARMQQVRNSKTTGAVLRWKKAKQKQQPDSTDAMLSTVTDTVRKKDNPPVVPPRGRAKQLPPDFALSTEMVVYANDAGVADAASTFSHFCDHHRARGNAMVDWTAAWRTWVRNEVKFSRNRTNGNGNGHAPRPGSKEDTRERTQAALAAFAPNDGTYDVRTGPRPREPLFEIFPNPQLGKP